MMIRFVPKVSARRAVLVGFALATAAAGLSATPAAADRYGRHRYEPDYGDRYVVAESRYGRGTVSGPVRRGPNGRWQVRMPHGTWIYCVRSCSETLRRQTLDFWESNGQDAPDVGPGYFTLWFGRR